MRLIATVVSQLRLHDVWDDDEDVRYYYDTAEEILLLIDMHPYALLFFWREGFYGNIYNIIDPR